MPAVTHAVGFDFMTANSDSTKPSRTCGFLARTLLVDATVGTDWSIGRVLDRWLIGYSRRLDEAFTSVSSVAAALSQEMYAQLLKSAQSGQWQ